MVIYGTGQLPVSLPKARIDDSGHLGRYVPVSPGGGHGADRRGADPGGADPSVRTGRPRLPLRRAGRRPLLRRGEWIKRARRGSTETAPGTRAKTAPARQARTPGTRARTAGRRSSTVSPGSAKAPWLAAWASP